MRVTPERFFTFTGGRPPSLVAPLPSCPWRSRPKHQADLSARRTHVNCPAADSSLAAGGWPVDPGNQRAETNAGVPTSVLGLLGSPSCPRRLSPQHQTSPFARAAQVWVSPAPIETTPRSVDTLCSRGGNPTVT